MMMMMNDGLMMMVNSMTNTLMQLRPVREIIKCTVIKQNHSAKSIIDYTSCLSILYYVTIGSLLQKSNSILCSRFIQTFIILFIVCCGLWFAILNRVVRAAKPLINVYARSL